MTNSVGLGAKAPAAPLDPGPKIAITIYNYAQVPRGTLDEAETVATRIFERAGIESSWQEYDATASGSAPVANTLEGQNWVHITVHVCSRSMASHLPLNRTYLGFAVVPGGKDHGDMAYVFYHRAQELAGERSLSVADSLGHVLAHEIGHLLLGANAHSPWGLMRARWDQEDLRRAAKGWLIFTDDESARLRAELRARWIYQEPASTSETAAARR